MAIPMHGGQPAMQGDVQHMAANTATLKNGPPLARNAPATQLGRPLVSGPPPVSLLTLPTPLPSRRPQGTAYGLPDVGVVQHQAESPCARSGGAP
jgi:hypothetical protein